MRRLALPRGSHALAAAALALFLFAGTASAQGRGHGVIADLRDNGKLDRSWSCERLLDALTELSEASQSGSLSMLDELDGRLRAECTAWPVPVNERELTVGASGPTASESEATLSAPQTEFQPADTDSGRIYSIPWEIVVAGIVSGGLVVLIGAAAVRQWRLLRP